MINLVLQPQFRHLPAKKANEDLAKSIRNTGKEEQRLSDVFNKKLKDQADGFTRLGRAAEAASRGIRSGFSGIGSGLEKAQGVLTKFESKLLSVRSILLGSAIGLGVSRVLELGRDKMQVERRVRRQFGDEAPALIDRAKQMAKMTGRTEDDALRGMIEIAQATSLTQAGTMYRGKRLNARQAAAVRAQTTESGARLLERVATLTPNADIGEVGRLIASSGTEEETITRMVNELGLNRGIVRQVKEAQSKKQIDKILTDAERKRYGNVKELMPADFIDLVLARSGMTDTAAAGERKTIGFQAGAASSKAKDRLGDLGGKFYEFIGRMSKRFGGSGTPAEAVDKAFDWAGSHLGTIGAVAGGYGLLRVGGSVIGAGKSVGGFIGRMFGSKTGGAAGELLSAAAGAGGMPVTVTNWPASLGGGLLGAASSGARELELGAGVAAPWWKRALGFAGRGAKAVGGLAAGALTSGAALTTGAVVGAGALGYGVGTLLDRGFGLSDLISGTGRFSRVQDADNQLHPMTPKKIDYRDLSTPMDLMSSQPPPINISIGNVNGLGGAEQYAKAISSHVEKEITRNLKNRTANGSIR